METTSGFQVNCFKHPTKKIQQVNTNINSKSHILCPECLLEDQSSKDLLGITEFLTIADDFYKKSPQKPATELKVPLEYIFVLDEQNKKLADLKDHILQEKHKIGQLFDHIKKEFIESLEAQRTESLAELDQQLSRLQYWHTFFEKKLRMTYPNIKTSETKTDPLQFEAYVRSIKEDLNEEILQLNKAKPFDQDKKFKLPSLYQRLIELRSTKPTYNIATHKMAPNSREELIDLKKELQIQLKDLLDTILTFENPIPDILDDCNCPNSQIITSSHYSLLNHWLPQEHKHQNLKLLYRGTKDGMNSSAFHEHCDYKGPTLTLINCTFYQSDKKSIIGGYLDKDWHGAVDWIKSDKAFLFSLTAKVKCPISNPEGENYAAFGQASLGPTFGQAHELTLSDDFRKNYVCPHEYENSEFLIDRKNQQYLFHSDEKSYGNNHFEVYEIEVYTFK